MILPRVDSGRSEGVLDVSSEVAEVAEKYLGIVLDPWQLHALARITAYDEGTGLFVHSTAAVVVARQNGKTQLLQALVLWVLLRGGRVVAGAQNLSEAADTWRELGVLFEDDAPLGHLLERRVLTHGSEALHLTNGGMYRIIATNKKSARGLRKVDLLWLDEVRELKSDEAYGAMTPTTATSPNPLIVLTSNAGEADSVVLNKVRDAGRAGSNPRLAYLEWSAPPGTAVDDLEAARHANPSPRISDGFLADQLATLTPARFQVEHRCEWVGALAAMVTPAEWDTATWLEEPPAPGKSVALAFSVDPARASATLVAAYRDEQDRLFVTLLGHWTDWSERVVAEAVLDAAGRINPTKVGFNGYTGGSVAHQLGRHLRNLLVDCKGAAYVTACAGFVDKVKAGQLWHDGSDVLAEHVCRAVPKLGTKERGAWWWDRAAAPGPTTACEAATLAVHLVDPAGTATRPRPVVGKVA